MSEGYERKIDRKLIMSIVALGLMSFTGVVVETSMNVAFPTLMAEFNVGTDAVQWVTTGYLLLLAIIIPISSFLKKRFYTKNLFLVAVILFIIGVIIDAAAPTFSMLILGRVIQGIGTGIALPLMFNVVLEQVPFEKLGFMMGVATFISAVAPAVGPSFGGMIVNLFGWRMIFISLLPVLIISFFMGIFSIRQVSKIEKIKFDWTGYILLAVAFACFIFATSFSGTYGWKSTQVILLLILSLVMLVIFVSHSKKCKIPVINIKVFSNISFSFSVIVFMLVQFICLGLGYMIPNYAQLVLGENPFIAGLLLLPGCILGAIFAPLSGRIFDKIGAKKPILVGNIFIIISTLVLSIFSQNQTLMLFTIFYMIFALGQNLTMGNTMTNGLKQLSQDLNNDGNAVLNTLQQLAGAIGTSIITSIVAISQASMPDDLALGTKVGSGNALILLFILSIIVLGCSLLAFHFIKKEKTI